MNVRLQDSAIRFGLSEEEFQKLVGVGDLETVTDVVLMDGGPIVARLNYGVVAVHRDELTRCEVHPNSIYFYVNADDLKRFRESPEVPVFVRRETRLGSGKTHRFLAYLEKEPAVAADVALKRPEAWIYQAEQNAPSPEGTAR